MKIFLADLSHTHAVKDTELMVPLNIGYVKAFAVEALGGSVDIAMFKHPQRLLDRLLIDKPDIVGLSNYTWNAGLNRHIGSAIRRLLPETLIIAGGPNVDEDVDGAKRFFLENPYLNFRISGGGEEPFTEMIRWWRDTDRDYAKLPMNVVWYDGKAVQRTELRKLKKVIDNIPSPYLNGHLDEFLDAGMVPLFESNRGCPFKCSFCAWGAASQDLLRRLDFDVTMAEFDYVSQRSKARTWMLCDANFGILERDVELARKMRQLRDQTGRPVAVQTFLAKNVTNRNLAIGDIMKDMTTATMSFQSLSPEVLVNINRDNISLDTYRDYQEQFSKVGNRTYSELIIPLPGETRETHIAALRQLIDSGVHELHVHNLRMLSGTKINAPDIREKYAFKTKFRLIHGDAGIYRIPDGTEIKLFEYEESLRQTNTMSEDDMFYFRKLQLFIELSWNYDVYGPLLKAAHRFGIHPIDVLMELVDFPDEPTPDDSPAVSHAKEFLALVAKLSHDEWFDSREAIEEYFAHPDNFDRIINLEFDKLNILGSFIVLRDYKTSFDALIKQAVRSFGKMPDDVLDIVADFTFRRFPSLDFDRDGVDVELPTNINDIMLKPVDDFALSADTEIVRLKATEKRSEILGYIKRSKHQTLSKMINSQKLYLRNLRLMLDERASHAEPYLFCEE